MNGAFQYGNCCTKKVINTFPFFLRKKVQTLCILLTETVVELALSVWKVRGKVLPQIWEVE